MKKFKIFSVFVLMILSINSVFGATDVFREGKRITKSGINKVSNINIKGNYKQISNKISNKTSKAYESTKNNLKKGYENIKRGSKKTYDYTKNKTKHIMDVTKEQIIRLIIYMKKFKGNFNELSPEGKTEVNNMAKNIKKKFILQFIKYKKGTITEEEFRKRTDELKSEYKNKFKEIELKDGFKKNTSFIKYTLNDLININTKNGINNNIKEGLKGFIITTKQMTDRESLKILTQASENIRRKSLNKNINNNEKKVFDYMYKIVVSERKKQEKEIINKNMRMLLKLK